MNDLAFTAAAATTGATRGRPSGAQGGLYGRAGKRLFDVGLALFLLPVLGPVILALWVLVRLDGGPGFFGHTRVGRGGRRFTCWKLRSMSADAEALLQAHLKADPAAAAEWTSNRKLEHDPRVSRLGRVLRRTSLDELPQIWNVLKGEMSFVGPRPVVAKELEKYGSSVTAYLAQTPGITGLWQVSGRNRVSYEARVALDVAYLTRCSFGKDLGIIARTGLAILSATGR